MKEADSSTKNLKEILDFEQRFISLNLEKIAMLDAEVKLKARKGANFPQHISVTYERIQAFNNFKSELRTRFLSVEEIKVNLLLTNLCNHLKQRLESFKSNSLNLGSKLSM